jgi:hypothetical protein
MGPIVSVLDGGAGRGAAVRDVRDGSYNRETVIMVSQSDGYGNRVTVMIGRE